MAITTSSSISVKPFFTVLTSLLLAVAPWGAHRQSVPAPSSENVSPQQMFRRRPGHPPSPTAKTSSLPEPYAYGAGASSRANSGHGT